MKTFSESIRQDNLSYNFSKNLNFQKKTKKIQKKSQGWKQQPNESFDLVKESVYNIHLYNFKFNKQSRQNYEQKGYTKQLFLALKRNINKTNKQKIYNQFWRAIEQTYFSSKIRLNKLFCHSENALQALKNIYKRIQKQKNLCNRKRKLTKFQLMKKQFEEISKGNTLILNNIQSFISKEYSSQNSQKIYEQTQSKIDQSLAIDIIKENLIDQINTIEKKLLAQSILYVQVVQTKKQQTNYKIKFDYALQMKDLFVSKEQLTKINLKKIYTIIGIDSTSVDQRKYFFNYRTKQFFQNLILKGKQQIINFGLQILQQDQSELIVSKIRSDHLFCHSCSMICPRQYMIQCNYKQLEDDKVVIPIEYFDDQFSIINGIIQKNKAYKIVSSHQDYDIFYNYAQCRKQNENSIKSCKRAYCVECVKIERQKKGFSYQGINKYRNKKCLFCTKQCGCTKCALIWHRRKLIFLYMKHHGSLQALKEKSYLRGLYKKNINNKQETKTEKILNEVKNFNKLSLIQLKGQQWRELKEITKLLLDRQKVKEQICKKESELFKLKKQKQ